MPHPIIDRCGDMMSPNDDRKKQELFDRAIREGINSGFTKFNTVEELMDDLNREYDPELLKSVERGYLECEAGLAEEVQDDDTFFQDILEEIRKNPESIHPETDWGPPVGKEKK